MAKPKLLVVIVVVAVVHHLWVPTSGICASQVRNRTSQFGLGQDQVVITWPSAWWRRRLGLPWSVQWAARDGRQSRAVRAGLEVKLARSGQVPNLCI